MAAMEKNNKNLNVPHLRFPEFSGEWERCTIGDITRNFSLRNKDKIQYPMFSVTNSRGFVPQSEQFEDREMIGEGKKNLTKTDGFTPKTKKIIENSFRETQKTSNLSKITCFLICP